MWSPDRELLKEAVAMLETLDQQNKCNTVQELAQHIRAQDLIERVNKHLINMGILR